MKERSGKGSEGGAGGGGGGGGTEGGVKLSKAVSQSHEPGWVGERMVRHPGYIYKHSAGTWLHNY